MLVHSALALVSFLQVDVVHGRPPRPAALRLESLRATVSISDFAATTELEQVFRNPSPMPLEETYLWPLPDDAAVSSFELWIDGKPQKGEVLDKDKARGIYEDIVRRQRDPALLEWVGRGCVRASIFPVPANGEARVRLRYATALARSGGAVEYALPLRLTSLAPAGVRSFVLDATIESSTPFASIFSPSHPVDVKRDGDRRARVSYESANVALDRDLQLLVQPADREFGAMLLAHRSAGEDGFFMLHVAPRFDLAPSRVLPKDVIFVVDTSGSMSGAKMAQAKKALEQCVGRLRAEDRFALVRFSTEAEAFRDALASPTAENVAAAKTWIDRLEARGGTNLDEGLTRALATARSDGRLTMVMLLTDGLPTIGVTDESVLRARVRERNAGSLRVFTFGIGDDVNTRLLDGLVEDTKGAREYVRSGEDVEVKVSALFDKVASPVLADVSIAFEGADAFDVYPKRLPDLFRGAPLVVTGRFKGDGRRTIRLSGRFGDARQEWAYEVEWPRTQTKNNSLRALWASRKIGFLLDEIRLRGSSPELVDEVRRLGREFAIVTPYTSFLVVEEGRRLAQARGIEGDHFRFADLDGDGRADAPAPGLLDLFARDEAEESAEAGRAKERLSGAASGPATGGGAVAASEEMKVLTVAKVARISRGEIASDRFVRAVDGRVFHLVGSVWIDRAYAGQPVRKVAFLSEEYFALLRESPALARVLALGPHVLVAWNGAFLEIG